MLPGKRYSIGLIYIDSAELDLFRVQHPGGTLCGKPRDGLVIDSCNARCACVAQVIGRGKADSHQPLTKFRVSTDRVPMLSHQVKSGISTWTGLVSEETSLV